MKPQLFFTTEQINRLRQAISEAENNTSGEIRIHIENTCNGKSLERAETIFTILGMHKTRLRNGILFYLAVKDRAFAVCGDQGIHEKVQAEFWETIKNEMQEEFAASKFTEGLCDGIRKAGEKLKQYFPLEAGDTNELSDEITFR